MASDVSRISGTSSNTISRVSTSSNSFKAVAKLQSQISQGSAVRVSAALAEEMLSVVLQEEETDKETPSPPAIFRQQSSQSLAKAVRTYAGVTSLSFW